MNSSHNGYGNSFSSNYSSAGTSSAAFYMLPQNSDQHGSSYSESQSYTGYYNSQNDYSWNSFQSSNTFCSNSFGSQSQTANEYTASLSSDMVSHNSFAYSGNDFSTNKRKNREFQPWTKRDSLKRPAPYASARGMNLMQKMGWVPGQGLGRCENGELEPKFPEIKMDKRGLDASKTLNYPISVKKVGGRKLKMTSLKIVTEGKNPISILEEYCSKRKIPAPKYTTVIDEGPVHAKNYLFKVTVDGVDYTAEKGCNVKQKAKFEAAKKCLIDLKILMKDTEK